MNTPFSGFSPFPVSPSPPVLPGIIFQYTACVLILSSEFASGGTKSRQQGKGPRARPLGFLLYPALGPSLLMQLGPETPMELQACYPRAVYPFSL